MPQSVYAAGEKTFEAVAAFKFNFSGFNFKTLEMLLCCLSHLRFSPISMQNIIVHVGALSVLCVVLCLSAILLVCLPWLATVRRCGGALALFVWGTLYVTAIVFIFTGGPVTTWEQVRRKQEENLLFNCS